jgi:hypothetical protein
MISTVKLRPGQKGTKKLVAEYGDALLCVRYRYDEQTGTRLKTIELIIERKPWKQTADRYQDNAYVPVRIEYTDKALRDKAKAAQGRWDPKKRSWYIQFGKNKGTELEKFMIP